MQLSVGFDLLWEVDCDGPICANGTKRNPLDECEEELVQC